MARNRHIRPEQVEAIVNAIHTWDAGTIAWDDVCKVAKPILGYLPSRSGLSSHADIQAAFSNRKKLLAQRPAGKGPSPASLADASRMIAARDGEISTLKHLVAEYREKFDRWRYNAMLHNLTIDKLDAPLPPIARSSR
ncbi:hypothetical protein [Roseateles puraquae]|uniref:Uncharacterized protein n=1 Tax=Roseateles puraquae TaxID=431059 RepID=A0A254NDV7_9BURK|nr:hypothetical protein [Roseateles puraquae]MDG0857428.1 hypothetical protein [Roseateles puraquae]OWR05940.1 hypothetical protein CDO81_05745 [Roseateles puraquae]